jgi:hypothetical protein
MEEHVQNVHYKLSRRKRGRLLGTDSDVDVDDEENDDDDDDLQPQSKTQRQF